MNELRAIMALIVGVCALAVASSVSPIVDHYASVGFAVLFGLLGLVIAAHVGREVCRELLFRAEMRVLDRRDAARRTPHTRAERLGR